MMVRKILFFIPLLIVMIVERSYSQFLSPEKWQIKFQREDIAPISWIDSEVRYDGEPTMAIKGDNKRHTNGCWTSDVKILPNTYYKFCTHFRPQSVENIQRSILARIIWKDSNGNQIGRAEYPATQVENKEGWWTISQTYQSPAETKTAALELVYRWDPDGSVYFGGTSFRNVDVPEKRFVSLATVNHRPRKSRSSHDNLTQFAKFVSQAGDLGADIVCLPEGITVVGTGKSYVEVSEPVPGPSTDFLGKVARKNRIYIVAGIYEREDDIVYNTAILLDRSGNLAGKYRKVCLPREEIQGGITPGNSFPTFETDFGRIGIMICWDVTFPEVARALRMNGAEVIFMPIWGGNKTLTEARAIENQTYLVSSSYDMISAVFDLEGKIIAEATEEKPVVITKIDLAEQKLWPWLGDLKNRIPREIPPREVINKSTW